MLPLFARRAIRMFMFLTAVPLLGLAVLLAFPSEARSSSLLVCEGIFDDARPALIPMLDKYRGEEKGLYYDPTLKKNWQVQYFTEQQRKPLELFIRAGLFHTADGKRADSPYEPDVMHFETSLIVIDKDSRIFVLHEEDRGRLHHSSLSAGEDIIFAGTVAFYRGSIREINNNSGHYQPSTAQTIAAIRELHRLGANLDWLRISGKAAKEMSGSYSMNPKEVRDYFEGMFSKK